MTEFNTLQTQCDDVGVLQITLNRPDKLNALSNELLGELHDVLHHAKKDNSIKAVLITGTGKAFCAGADIQRLAELDAAQGLAFAQEGQHIFRHFSRLGKPTLAAINGYAFGGGCELAIATNLRIASTNASFSQPEIKLGLIPGYGGTQRLARLIGKGRAMDMCLTGKTINTQQALDWGLISETTTPENLLPRAYEILHTLVKLAPLALVNIIQVIEQGYELPLAEALELEASHFSLLCDTKDKKEGVQAFLQKREAHFIGE